MYALIDNVETIETVMIAHLKGLISTIITELIKFRVPCCRGGNQARDKSWWKFEVFPGLKGSVRVKKKTPWGERNIQVQVLSSLSAETEALRLDSLFVWAALVTREKDIFL